MCVTVTMPHQNKSVAVAKKADRTEYDIRYIFRTEPLLDAVAAPAYANAEVSLTLFTVHSGGVRTPSFSRLVFWYVLWLNNTS